MVLIPSNMNEQHPSAQHPTMHGGCRETGAGTSYAAKSKTMLYVPFGF